MSKPIDSHEDAVLADRASRMSTTSIHAENENPHAEHIQDYITQMNTNISETVAKWYNDLSTAAANDPGLQKLQESINSSIQHVQTQHLNPWMKSIRDGAEEAQQTIATNNECLKKNLEEFGESVNKSVTTAWEAWCKDNPEQAKLLAQKNADMKSWLDGLNSSIQAKIEETKKQYSTHQEKCHKKNCEQDCVDVSMPKQE